MNHWLGRSKAVLRPRPEDEERWAWQKVWGLSLVFQAKGSYGVNQAEDWGWGSAWFSWARIKAHFLLAFVQKESICQVWPLRNQVVRWVSSIFRHGDFLFSPVGLKGDPILIPGNGNAHGRCGFSHV